MSAFYVGQRVRIVRSRSRPDIVGRETTITGPLQAGYNSATGWYEGYPVAIAPSPGFRAVVLPPDFLEPIVDDGRKVVSWSDCLWQPEGVSA